jgi:hypothetical protein
MIEEYVEREGQRRELLELELAWPKGEVFSSSVQERGRGGRRSSGRLVRLSGRKMRGRGELGGALAL